MVFFDRKLRPECLMLLPQDLAQHLNPHIRVLPGLMCSVNSARHESDSTGVT